jgi:hypothetical protein
VPEGLVDDTFFMCIRHFILDIENRGGLVDPRIEEVFFPLRRPSPPGRRARTRPAQVGGTAVLAALPAVRVRYSKLKLSVPVC